MSHGGQSVAATEAGVTEVRGVKSMHVRTGSGKLNPVMKKKDGEASESRVTPLLEN